MLKVIVPNNNISEREYIIHVLLEVFLGLEYSIEVVKNYDDYKIILSNGKELIIEDSFFRNYKKAKTYLNIKNIPSQIAYLNNVKFNVKNLPVLYGNENLIVDKEIVNCGLDLFASSFFMLTRWEEFVNTERDHHSRFSSKSSLAFKFKFLNRPIVNEYVELLWNMLVHLGVSQKRKERKFQIIPTHDVDLPRLWWDVKDVIKSLAGNIFKNFSFKSAYWTIITYSKTLFGAKDPFDTFDELMTLSEKNNLTSHFFFMSGGTSNKDNFYSIKNPVVKKLMIEIKQRGHIIGFHPSYNTYNQSIQFNKELELLKETSQVKIDCGRGHFLRFELPTTWQIWENNGMKWDSSMSYADKEGFRCGVCYPFPVFNILDRKQLNLYEKPLIVMDGSLVTYQAMSVEEGYNKVNNLLQKVKEHNGEFVFLWHNSAFNTTLWKPFQIIYERILNENSNNHRS